MNEGAEIEIEYIPFDSELNFYYKGKCIKLTKVTSNVSMKEYGLDGKIGIKDLLEFGHTIGLTESFCKASIDEIVDTVKSFTLTIF